MIEAIIVF